MEHHQNLRFLFLRGLTAIFVVVGLGVKDDQNDFRGISSLKHTWTGTAVSWYSCPDVLRKIAESVSSTLQKCVQNAGAHVQILHK